jgi:glycosyltransferase involved in cell wall biosynthesis
VKISVITTVLNARDTLPDALDSLWAQDYPDVEHIVIDGGSTDGTVEFIESHRGRIDYFSSEPDDGLYDAFNKGIRAATGDIVGFLHADDLFAGPTVLSDLVGCMSQTDATLVYGDLRYVDRAQPERIIRHWHSGVYSKRQLVWGWMPPHPTLFVNRALFLKVGLFDTQFRIAGDYDHILRLFSHEEARSAYLEQVVTLMRVGGVSNRSLSNLRKKSSEDYRIIKAHLGRGALTLLAKNLRKIPQFIAPKLRKSS